MAHVHKEPEAVARSLTLESGDISSNDSFLSRDEIRIPFLKRTSRLKIPLENDIRHGLKGDPRAAFILRCYLLFATRTNHEANPLEDIAWAASTERTGTLFRFFAGHSIAASLDSFDHELARLVEPCLRICAINAGAATEQGLSFYRLWSSLRFRWQNKMELASQVVPILINFLLRKNWNMENTASHIDHIVMKAYLPSKLNLPSQTMSTSVSHLFNPSQDGKLEWRWLRKCPVYESDLNIYVWQPFSSLPDLDVVQMHVQSPTAQGQQSILLITSSKDVLRRVQTTYSAADIPAFQDIEDQLFALLAMIYKMIREEIAEFRNDAIQQTAHLDLQIRQSPSSSKITYLLHLQECYRHVAQHCHRNKATLAMIREAFRRKRSQPSSPTDLRLYDILQIFETCAHDLEYLAEELMARAKEIDEMNARVKQLMDIKDKWRTQLVTILVSIYVPLAFATSYFGMNVGHKQQLTYWTNATTYPTLQDPNSPTPVTAGASASASVASTMTQTNAIGPNIAPEWQFWLVALMLTFGSIIIPTVAGPVYREAALLRHKHKTGYRIGMSLIVITVVFLISFLSFYGQFKIHDRNTFDTWMLYLAICVIVGSYLSWYIFMAISLRNLELCVVWVLLLACFTSAIAGQIWWGLGGALGAWLGGMAVIFCIWCVRPNAIFNLVEYRRKRERAARERQLQAVITKK